MNLPPWKLRLLASLEELNDSLARFRAERDAMMRQASTNRDALAAIHKESAETLAALEQLRSTTRGCLDRLRANFAGTVPPDGAASEPPANLP